MPDLMPTGRCRRKGFSNDNGVTYSRPYVCMKDYATCRKDTEAPQISNYVDYEHIIAGIVGRYVLYKKHPGRIPNRYLARVFLVRFLL